MFEVAGSIRIADSYSVWEKKIRCYLLNANQIMRSRFRFIVVVFYFTAVLIFTVYLRSADNRIFYKLCTHNTEQSRLKQQLWQKQLQLENLINPAAVSQHLGE